MTNKNFKRDDGFTIIEVLIVLAIAGLIMLIVFLAVPALQRNARNTSRKSDIGSLASAISEYVNNNDGELPTTSGNCGSSANCPFIVNWKPGYYTGSEVTYTYNSTPAAPPADPANGDKVLIETYMTCNNTQPVTGASRAVAIIYDVETGSGTQEQCTTAQ